MYTLLLKRRGIQHAAKTSQTPAIAIADVVAGSETTGANVSTMADKPWEEIQAAFKQDLSYLRTLAGSNEKEPYKQSLVDKYRPVVEKLKLTHDSFGNLDVMWWFYQWQTDLGHLVDVYDDFRAAIEKGLTTPNSWKSNAQTAFCDLIYQYSADNHYKGASFQAHYLVDAVNDLLCGNLAVNAPLKVKMLRMVGHWAFDAGEKEKALRLYKMVMTLDPNKGGCKTRLKELEEEFE